MNTFFIDAVAQTTGEPMTDADGKEISLQHIYTRIQEQLRANTACDHLIFNGDRVELPARERAAIAAYMDISNQLPEATANTIESLLSAQAARLIEGWLRELEQINSLPLGERERLRIRRHWSSYEDSSRKD